MSRPTLQRSTPEYIRAPRQSSYLVDQRIGTSATRPCWSPLPVSISPRQERAFGSLGWTPLERKAHESAVARELADSNLGPLGAIGEQKATQFFAQLAVAIRQGRRGQLRGHLRGLGRRRPRAGRRPSQRGRPSPRNRRQGRQGGRARKVFRGRRRRSDRLRPGRLPRPKAKLSPVKGRLPRGAEEPAGHLHLRADEPAPLPGRVSGQVDAPGYRDVLAVCLHRHGRQGQLSTGLRAAPGDVVERFRPHPSDGPGAEGGGLQGVGAAEAGARADGSPRRGNRSRRPVLSRCRHV